MTLRSSAGAAGSPLGGGLPPRPRRSRASVAGYWAMGLVGLAAALGALAVAVLLLAPPLDAVRDRLIRQVHERAGRTLTVAGPMSVALLPRPVVTLEGVALLPPAGMTGEPTVTVPSVTAEVSLWSLIARRPKLGRITLHRPVVELFVDAEGRRSWDAAPQPKSLPPAPSAAPNTSVPTKARRWRPLELRVTGGTVRFRNERSGLQHLIDAVDADLTLGTPEAAVAVAGTFRWEGEAYRFSVSGTGDDHKAFIVKLAGAPLDLTYEGRLSLQGGVAGEGTLALAHVVFKQVKLGPAKLGLSVAAGTATVTLQDMAVYGGRGVGSLSVDTTGSTPVISASLKLTDVSLMPLLADTAGVTWLDGRGMLTLALGAKGATEKELVESLQGKVELAVADGAVTGFDVERMLRALERGRLDRLAPRRQDKTSFSAFTGTFDIAGGVARTGDLKLVSKHVELKGEGQIDLMSRRIDAVLETRIDGGAPGKDAVVSIGTMQLPIAIKGPLDRPEFSIRGQEAVTDAIGKLGKALKSPEVQDLIKGLLGGGKRKAAGE